MRGEIFCSSKHFWTRMAACTAQVIMEVLYNMSCGGGLILLLRT